LKPAPFLISNLSFLIPVPEPGAEAAEMKHEDEEEE
jgi:hypothetical protein